MTTLFKTTVPDNGLTERLKEAAKYKMTPKEIFEQKVSFVYGQLMDTNDTRSKTGIRESMIAMSDHP